MSWIFRLKVHKVENLMRSKIKSLADKYTNVFLGVGFSGSRCAVSCPEHVFVVFSESEDEVEELEERVPSPDVAPEESAPFYDSTAWYGSKL